MPWFAQFLCELLLQVGLAPVEETDEDLLNIADKDKLQVSNTVKKKRKGTVKTVIGPHNMILFCSTNSVYTKDFQAEARMQTRAVEN